MTIPQYLKNLLFLILLCLFIIFAFASVYSNPQAKSLDLTVEYALTSEERQLGLMNRTSLCQNCGMLFNFDPPQHVSFWMKDTYIPLDIIMVEESGVVDIVHQDTLPNQTTQRYTSNNKVKYVLEANSGYARSQEIASGDILDIEELIAQAKPYGYFVNNPQE